jgi:hypothetical protein
LQQVQEAAETQPEQQESAPATDSMQNTLLKNPTPSPPRKRGGEFSQLLILWDGSINFLTPSVNSAFDVGSFNPCFFENS